MPLVRVWGYSVIPPNTQIKVLVTNIQSISKNYQTTIKIGVEDFNKKPNMGAYLYKPTPYIPDQTKDWIFQKSVQPITMTHIGSDKVHGTRDFTFTFTAGS